MTRAGAAVECAAETVFQVIDTDQADDAGIGLRFQCQTCGAMLSRAVEAHEQERDGT